MKFSKSDSSFRFFLLLLLFSCEIEKKKKKENYKLAYFTTHVPIICLFFFYIHQCYTHTHKVRIVSSLSNKKEIFFEVKKSFILIKCIRKIKITVTIVTLFKKKILLIRSMSKIWNNKFMTFNNTKTNIKKLNWNSLKCMCMKA